MENNDLICPNCQKKTVWGARCQQCGMDLSNVEMLFTISVKHYNNTVLLCKDRHLIKAFREIVTSINIFPYSNNHLHFGMVIATEIGEFQYALSLLNQMQGSLDADVYFDTLASLQKATDIYNEILQNKFIFEGQKNLLLIHYYLLHIQDTNFEHPELVEAIEKKDKYFINRHSHKEPQNLELKNSAAKKPFSFFSNATIGVLFTISVLFILTSYNLHTKLGQLEPTVVELGGENLTSLNEESVCKLILLVQKKDNLGTANLLVSDSTLVSLLEKQQLALLTHSLYEDRQFDLITKLPFDSQEKPLATYHVLWSDYAKEKAQGKVQASTLLKMQVWVEGNLHIESYLGEVALALFRHYESADPALALKYAKIIRDWVHEMPTTDEYKQYLNGPVQRSLNNES